MIHTKQLNHLTQTIQWFLVHSKIIVNFRVFISLKKNPLAVTPHFLPSLLVLGNQ